LIIVVLLSVSIFELGRGAVGRLLAGAAPAVVSPVAVAVLVGTLAVNIAVVIVETRAGRRLDSPMLLADALHTRVDVFITLAVLGGLGLVSLGVTWADAALALVVAVLVGHAGYQIVRRSIPTLVDERAIDPANIRSEAERVDGVRAAYAIRSRGPAIQRFAELTIAVDGTSDVVSAHQIADRVEARLHETLAIHEVVVHVEPC